MDIFKDQLIKESSESIINEVNEKRKARNKRKADRLKKRESIDNNLKTKNIDKKNRRNAKRKAKKCSCDNSCN
jgi:hypothetical protein